MRTTISVVNSNFILKTGSNPVRSGDIFSIRITENKNGLIKAFFRGKTISLKGPQDLKINSILRVRAQWNGKTLILNRIPENNSLKEWITDFGVKDNSASLNLFEAVKRSGGHLDDDNLRLLKRLLRKRKDLGKEESRTAAEIIKKGLAAEDLLGVTGRYDGNKEKQHEKALLFNHLTNLDELWFIVPYSFSVADTDADEALEGSIRIQKNIKSKEILSVVIEVSIFGNRYFFLINNYNGKNRKLRLFTESEIPEGNKKYIKKLLPEILGNLLIKFDDNIIENCFKEGGDKHCFDGFSATETTLNSVEEVI